MTRRVAPALVVGLLAVGACGGDDSTSPPPSSVVTASTVAVATPSTTTTIAGSPTTISGPLTSSTTSTTSTSSTTPVHDPDDVPSPEGAIVPEGFPRTRATVTTADGRICELCVWVAEGDLRSRGLSSVDDIGPADGMVFVYPEPDTRTFNMEFVAFDLEIAFFDAAGAYLDAFAMEACPLGGCRRYRTPEDISLAFEVRPGSLPDLGIGPGSTFELTELPCP